MKKRPPLIDRRVTDENFDHCIGLLGACAAWAETVEVGQKMEWNDINMIVIPVEMALGFVREHLSDQTPRGAAARQAFDMLRAFREARAAAPPAPSERDAKVQSLSELATSIA